MEENSQTKIDLGIWDILTRLLIGMLIIAGIAAVFVWYWPVIRQNERMRKEVMRLDALIQVEEEKSKQLKTAVDLLQHDQPTIERLARESLGYAKTGEVVIRFEVPASNLSSTR